MNKEGTILVVDDNKGILTALEMLLLGTFKKVISLNNPNQILSTLETENVDVLLLDMNFSAGINTGNEGIFWLGEIRKYRKELPVVLFTAYADIELAVKAVKEGATDFVVKPWDNAKLVATLLSAYHLNKSRTEVKHLKEKEKILKTQFNNNTELIWGESPSMQHLHNLIRKVAITDANILITGENGTGKEMIAKEIHACSKRKNEIMISVDMGAVTETLFESELFGHVKGTFTDAKEDRAGKFEAANKGTLFLDEIGNLSYALQSKLLAALQSRKITRVGSNKPIETDIRLICATNSNLLEMVANNAFREDLLYRINTIHLEVPPLRERGNDILLLANYFLQKYSRKYEKSGLFFKEETEKRLLNYNWPGNIRELQHSIEKAVIICDETALKPEDFFFKATGSAPATGSANQTLQDMEKDMIEKAIKQHGGNISAIAAQLGITRQTLYNKMKKFGL